MTPDYNMNVDDYLLCKLQEECGEVIQAASKIIMFGWHSEYQNKTNIDNLKNELNDILAIVELLNKNTILDYKPNELALKAKQAKVRNFKKYNEKFNGFELKL